MALIAKGIRRNTALTFATGLSNYELEKVLNRCIEWGFVALKNKKPRITDAGLDELEHARRTNCMESEIAPLGDEDYYPKMLREATSG